MIEQVIKAVINQLLLQGSLGVSVIVLCLGMGFVIVMGHFYSVYKERQLKALIEEHKQDKQQLIDIIKNNTEAMTKTSSAVENCTSALQQNTYLLQRLLNRWGI